jgi:membrane protease YdiL (CAAX protease family)
MFGAMTPPFSRYPLGIRILLMMAMFLFNFTIVSFIAIAAAAAIFGLSNMTSVLEGTLNGPADFYAFLFIQGVSSLGIFVLTAMMFSVLESGEFVHHLRLKTLPSLRFVILAVLAVIVAQFFIEFLVGLNEKIPLPPSLQFLYDLQKRTEEITNSLMSFTDFGSFIIVSIVVALIPAIGEEFFFRGLFLGDLLKGKAHPAIAIPVSGLVFALSHMEFNNILAIWTLGAFLGYLYYISGSLWLPIIVHFVNNFFAVLIKYLFNLGMISKEVADAKTPLYATIISLAIFGLFIFLFNKWKNPADFVEPEEAYDNETPSE